MAYTNPATKSAPAPINPITGVLLAINCVLLFTGFIWHSLVGFCNYLEFILIPHSFSTEMEEPLLRKISKLLAVHDHLKDGSTYSGRLSQLVQKAEYEPRRKLATFRSTRRNIYELRGLLELVLPMFNEYPWSQMVPNAGLNMSVLCGLVRKLLIEDEGLSYQPKTVTVAVNDDYNRWCAVLEVEHLTFGLSDMVEEILFNYRFHQGRTGKMTKFGRLPTEIQCMIV
uniref:ArAE_2_N domain-containing protein n=2 Tax=Bursaphelenchus xylophilus TaxID=6326 RepID=A0A1I7RIL2_BURXY